MHVKSKQHGENDSASWERATVVSVHDKVVTVEDTEGSSHEVQRSNEKILPISITAAGGAPNMIDLDVLHEGAIQENIRTRYFRDDIYTLVGPILISVNPYRMIPNLYTDATKALYLKSKVDALGNNEMQDKPHLYLVADRAFEAMVRPNGRNQSILISGESGAGKTEATKIVLQYLTSKASVETKRGSVEQTTIERIHSQIFASNPILEAFGNAKTVRNNNSSRFGKFFQVQFDAKGQIVGASIIKYLLEKTRVVHQSVGERNYHIFYQMCANDEWSSKLGLMAPEEYLYLNQSGCYEIDGVDDSADMDDVVSALLTIGVEEDVVHSMFSMLAAILSVGNIRFVDDENSHASIEDEAPLEHAASLLGIESGELRKALVQRTMAAGTGVRRQSVYKIPLDASAAGDTRDALAKELYASLFDWLVERINSAIDNVKKMRKSIGVLDIFGFEVFDVNSFEQLCINYANEKLHQQFINYYFKLEQEDYKREGVPIDKVNFSDNQPCLDLIEGRPLGVIALLQEECRLKTATDRSFVEKMKTSLKGKPHYKPSRLDPISFIIEHFAGSVTYNTTGFLEKNKDTVNTDLEDAMLSTSHAFIKKVIERHVKSKTSGGGGAGGGGKKSIHTVANNFKEQLNSLSTMLKSSDPHYIRCLKPNPAKQQQLFEGNMILEQLRYSGVLESVQIRLAGYSSRMLKNDFVSNFELLVRSLRVGNEMDVKCRRIIEIAKLPAEKYALGKTKVFFKDNNALSRIQEVMAEYAFSFAVKLQSAFRRHSARKKFKEIRNAVIAMQKSRKAALLHRYFLACKRLALLVNPIVRGFIVRRRYREELERIRADKQRRMELAAAAALEKKSRIQRLWMMLKGTLRAVAAFSSLNTSLRERRVLITDDGDDGAADGQGGGGARARNRRRVSALSGRKSVIPNDGRASKPRGLSIVNDDLYMLNVGQPATGGVKALNFETVDHYIESLRSQISRSGGLAAIGGGRAGLTQSSRRDAGVLMKGYVLACFNADPKRTETDRWHLRYCMLTRGKLLCFTSTDCDELKAELHLSTCDVTVEKIEHEEGSRPYPDETYRYVLCISTFGSTSGAVCSLATATESNRREWIDAANEAARPGHPPMRASEAYQQVATAEEGDDDDSEKKPSYTASDVATNVSVSAPSPGTIGAENTHGDEVDASRALAPTTSDANDMMRLVGWLWVQVCGARDWQRRFVTLGKSALAWFADDSCSEAIGRLPLGPSVVLSTGAGSDQNPEKQKATRDLWIGVSGAACETLLLSTDKKDMLDRWFSKLEACVRGTKGMMSRLEIVEAAVGEAPLREGWLLLFREPGEEGMTHNGKISDNDNGGGRGPSSLDVCWKYVYAVLTMSRLCVFVGSDLFHKSDEVALFGASVHLGQPERIVAELPQHERSMSSSSEKLLKQAVRMVVLPANGALCELAAPTPEEAIAWRCDIEHAALRVRRRERVVREGWVALADKDAFTSAMDVTVSSDGDVVVVNDAGVAGDGCSRQRSLVVRKWKRRYLVLEAGGLLTCYRNDNYEGTKGVMQLSSSGNDKVLSRVLGLPIEGHTMKGYSYLVQLSRDTSATSASQTSRAASWLFGTSSFADMAAWHKAISVEAMKANMQETMSALSLSGSDTVDFKGWLFKRRKGGLSTSDEEGSWRRRFFVLYSNGALAQFEDENMQELVGELRLDADALIEPSAGTPQQPESNKFKVSAGDGRVVQLMAKTLESASAWMLSMLRVRTSLSQTGASHTNGSSGGAVDYYMGKVVVKLPDGTCKTVSVREGMTVNMGCLAVGDNLGLRVKSFSGLGLIECIESIEMRLLGDGEVLTNVLKRWNELCNKRGEHVECCLILRVVVVPDPIPSNARDPVLCEMLFHQVRQLLLGFVPVNVEDAIQVSSKLLTYEMARSSEHQLPTPERLAVLLPSVLPKMITSTEMRTRPGTAIAAAILNAMPAYQEHAQSVAGAMMEFLNFTIDYFPLSHGEVYAVTPHGEWASRLPPLCSLVINSRGIHILESASTSGTNEWITTVPYQDVLRYGSSTHRLAIFVTMDDTKEPSPANEHKIEFVMKQEGRATEVVMLSRAYAVNCIEKWSSSTR